MTRSNWDINLEEGLEMSPEHIKKVCQCRRRVFSTEEDKLIAELVSSHKFMNWHEIAQRINGKTARQCRDRWTNYLSPTNSFAPWTREEDELIVEKVNEIGTKWSAIAKFVKGRSDNTIKNRWYSGLRKNCILGPNGLYVLKQESENFLPTAKNPNSQGKYTTRVKASPRVRTAKIAYPSNSPSAAMLGSSNKAPNPTVQSGLSSNFHSQKLEELSHLQNLPFQCPRQQTNHSNFQFYPQTIQQGFCCSQMQCQSTQPFRASQASQKSQTQMVNSPQNFNQSREFQALQNQSNQIIQASSSSQTISCCQPEEAPKVEPDSRMEDIFWDRQIFSQMNEMNKDPFQIPELYGEWF